MSMDRSPPYLLEMISKLDLLIAAVAGLGGSFTDASGTITTGGTSQEALAANTSRKSVLIHNPSSEIEALFVNFTDPASTSGDSIELLSGEKIVVNTVGAINLLAATTGHKFVVKELA